MENNTIQEKINATLNSLDGIRMAPSNPYLLTRIRARMGMADQENFWWKASRFLSRPAVITACVFLCIVINFVALSIPQEQETTVSNNATSILNTQNQDLSVTIAGIYDFENMEP